MPKIKLWTIERRGASFILMSWESDLSHGPNEVLQFKSLDAAKVAAEKVQGSALTWREARGAEIKHDVVAAADV